MLRHLSSSLQAGILMGVGVAPVLRLLSALAKGADGRGCTRPHEGLFSGEEPLTV
ncbi:hypothetical protein KSZ_15850 [Dictyobacter formicarum]|uniref:Uncharacterized protein n=1 Tax=Dictyobacter formicarum TaxID=2778368 RepID=A0ABQ3VC08_9CHLR|nr:hypothetical protein KSZ_15850 [Dictyobacter formicarum]